MSAVGVRKFTDLDKRLVGFLQLYGDSGWELRLASLFGGVLFASLFPAESFDGVTKFVVVVRIKWIKWSPR